MQFLLTLAVLSLLSPFRVQTGTGFLRPFDVLTAIMFVWMILRVRSFKPSIPRGFLMLTPFFAWHVISAVKLGSGNALRESIQVSVLLAFALVLANELPRLDFRKLGRFMVTGLIAIMSFNIGWHIFNGHWSGWKLLNDPKAAFTFLPLAAGIRLPFTPRQRQLLYGLLWGFLGVLIFMSGERKALIVFGVLTAVIVSRARFVPLMAAGAAGFLALWILSFTVQDPYLAKQTQTLIGGTTKVVVEGQQVESMSNGQRKFAWEVAKQQIALHPITGVGTNGLLRVMKSHYASYPKFLQLSFHGEFVRVLTENGAVGLFLYLMIWVVGAVRTYSILVKAVRVGRISRDYMNMFMLILFTACLMYVGFEASTTRSMVVVVIISLTADALRYALFGSRPPAPVPQRTAYRPRPYRPLV